MDWSKIIKPNTIENAIVQLVVCAVFFTGYMTYGVIADRREMKKLKAATNQDHS